MKWVKKQIGFTIVELLVVIVVIAILAAITIVAYTGLQNRTRDGRVRAEAAQATQKIETLRTTSTSDTYPTNLGGTGLDSSSSPVILQYSVTAQGKGFCLVAQEGSIIYSTTQALLTPQAGSCGTVQGLVGWWPLNNDTLDYSGNNLHGQPFNVTPVAGAKGLPATAYDFNGTSSQIICGMSDLLRPTGQLTLTAWIRPDTTGSSARGVVSNGTEGYWLGVTGAAATFSVKTSMQSTSTIPITPNSWYFIAARYGSPVGSTFQLEVYSSDNVGSLAGNMNSVSPQISNYGSDTCQIGSIKSLANQWFDGRIDDVRIYNRFLTGDETDLLYSAGAY